MRKSIDDEEKQSRSQAESHRIAERKTRKSFFILLMVGVPYAFITQIFKPFGDILQSYEIHRLVVYTLGFVALLMGYAFYKYLSNNSNTVFPFSWDSIEKLESKKFSYISSYTLTAIPIICYIADQELFKKYFYNIYLVTLNMKISFFAAFFLTIAPIISLAIRPASIVPAGSGTEMVVQLPAEEAERFRNMSKRAICSLPYALGFILSILLLVRIALFVAQFPDVNRKSIDRSPQTLNVLYRQIRASNSILATRLPLTWCKVSRSCFEA